MVEIVYMKTPTRSDRWIDAWSEAASREKMTGMLDMLTR
jgi:hypothetical protein